MRKFQDKEFICVGCAFSEENDTNYKRWHIFKAVNVSMDT